MLIEQLVSSSNELLPLIQTQEQTAAFSQILAMLQSNCFFLQCFSLRLKMERQIKETAHPLLMVEKYL